MHAHAAVSPSMFSTIVRTNVAALGVWMIRGYFRAASRMLPALARRQAERLFTTPPRGQYRPNAIDARRDTVVAGGRPIAVWQAGAPAAPAVLLAHGWGGCGAQMATFVAPLRERGFRVVWFDQPGHGESGTARVTLPDFVRSIEALDASHGPFHGAIGHSLGSAALGIAMRRGFAPARVVFVSPPASMREHASRFARALGIAPRVRDAMRRRLERRHGMRFDDIDRIEELEALNVRALFVHDRHDAQVPIENSQRLRQWMRGARLLVTHGFGHNRILREPSVAKAVADFVAGGEAVPWELPALPRPAPLY